jgi:general secretion pathway protein L
VPILKNVLGLDIGSFSLKAVELRKTLKGHEVAQVQMLEREGREEPLSELIAEFMDHFGFSSEHVVTALAGDRISSRRLEFPFRDRRKLAQAVPFEVESDLPFDLEDFVVNWQRVGGDRARSEVFATLAPRSEVSDLLTSLADAHCEARTLEAEGLALGNLASAYDLSGSRLLVDLGHRKTTLCLLLNDHPVAARTFPLAGSALTEALAKDRNLSPEDAERAKCEEGLFRAGPLGPQSETTSEAITVLNRIAREIARTLSSLEPVLVTSGSGAVSEITLMGGTAQLDRIDHFLSERIGIYTERLGLPKPGSSKGLAAGGSPLLFAPATALALRGTSAARTHMNFRQDEFARRLDLSSFRRDFRTTGWLAAVAVGLALLSFGTGLVFDSRQIGLVEAQTARVYSEALPGQAAPANAVASLRDAVRAANDRAEFLGVYGGNLSALDVLAEISKYVPEDLEIVLEEISIDRQTVRMKVYSKSFEAADRLGSELGRFAPFAGASIGAIETDRKRGGKRFSVTISLADAEERR